MATIFTHPAIALGLSPLFAPVFRSKRILLMGMILTVIPDLDVIGLRLGIPYNHLLGHRGITHSLFFAAGFSCLISLLMTRNMRNHFSKVWLYFFLCMASHGALDALTNGGLGIAFFSPFSNERYFFPYTPIEVSTLNIARFFQGQGIPVIKSEIIWIWIPCLFVFLAGMFGLKKLTKTRIKVRK